MIAHQRTLARPEQNFASSTTVVPYAFACMMAPIGVMALDQKFIGKKRWMMPSNTWSVKGAADDGMCRLQQYDVLHMYPCSVTCDPALSSFTIMVHRHGTQIGAKL